MSTASAGRAAIGPLRLSVGQMQMGRTQTAGTAVATNSIIVKFQNGF